MDSRYGAEGFGRTRVDWSFMDRSSSIGQVGLASVGMVGGKGEMSINSFSSVESMS